MSHALKTTMGLAFALVSIGSVSEAHMLRDRNFDFGTEYTQPFDEIGEMLKDLPDLSSEDPATDDSPEITTKETPPTAPLPTTSLPVVTGDAVEVLNTYNKMTVGHGNAQSPTFTITQPMMITYLQTYHWNGGQGTPLPGQIGLSGQGAWQAEGRPGMGNVPNAEWIATPAVVLPAGTYTVTDSAAESWAHNSHSQHLGFAVVRAAPVSAAPAAPDLLTLKLSEREALEQLVSIAGFKDWVLAVRANGNSVVYDLTNDPTTSCTDASCNWCFRMLEDTPSHRTFFETYCVDAISGAVSAGIE